MTSTAIWQLAFGLVLVIVMFGIAVGARRTISIGTLLVMIPFQILDNQYASSSVLIAYVLVAALQLGDGLKLRMLAALGAIMLAYCASLALADKAILIYHVLFMFQFFSCLVVFILAYNFALSVENEHTAMDVLLAINVLAIGYCGLQLSVGPGERFVPFGIEQFMFNLNRDPDDPRLVGPFGNPGSTAGYFALMTLVCAFEIMFSAGRRRFLAWVLTGFNILGLVATGNRAGFLVLLAMSPLLLFAYRRELGVRRIMQLAAGGFAVMVVAATLAVTYTDFDRMFMRMETVTETEGGIPTTRAEGWPIAIEKIKRHPWFGEGPHYWTAEDAEKIGQSQAQFVPGGALDTAFDHYPHSLYLYLLRTVGIFGLLAVVGFFVRTWLILLGATRREPMTGYQLAFTKLGLFLIPAFLISQITLEFHRLETMDYAQFIFALMGLLVGISDRNSPLAQQDVAIDRAATSSGRLATASARSGAMRNSARGAL
jgi:O-antigen ligase/polysaccharide polymerase Wzy-like membrane protein